MKILILIWSLLLPYMALAQMSNPDTQYRNDGDTLINGSFEQGKKGYTLTVGSGSPTWSTQATTKLTGKAMQLTLSAQTFNFKSNTTQGSDLSGQNGYIEVYLSASTSGAEFCPLVDGVSAPTTTPNECQPIIAGVGFKPYGIQKTFGASSLNYEIRGVSGASYTGTIYIDDGSIAKKSVVANMSGAQLYGGLKYVGANLCEWQLTSATFASFSADTDCATPSIYGKIKAPSTKIPAIVLPSGSPSGTYYIVAKGMFYVSSGNYGTWRFSDGTNSSDGNVVYQANTSIGSVIGQITYNTPITADTTINIQNKNNGGASFLTANTTSDGLGIEVYYFPPQPISTINATSNGWFIDANIGGADPALNGIFSTYTEVTNASLDMVINTSKGSAPAEIACANGTASTGLTCSAVNESIGIAFIPPKTGKYKACFYYSSNYGNGTAGAQIIETPNNSTTILQEGGTRFLLTQTAGSVGDYFPQSNCGVFKFDDTNKKTIRLMFEKNSATDLSIRGARDASVGQPDIHITIEPIVENLQASLQGISRFNGYSGELKKCIFDVSGAVDTFITCSVNGTCSISKNWGGCISGAGVTNNGSGTFTINFNTGYWSSSTSYQCFNRITNWQSGSVASILWESAKSQNQITAILYNASGTSTNGAFTYECTGY